MATVRSEYSFDQFDTVLQKFAHEIAKEVVTTLNTRDGGIGFRNHGIESIETDKYSIRFSAATISFSRRDKDEYWGFEVEEKLYATSNHRTKISFTVQVKSHYDRNKGEYGEYVEDESRKAKEKKRGEEILEFIEQLMVENAIKPVPRFSLSDMVQAPTR